MADTITEPVGPQLLQDRISLVQRLGLLESKLQPPFMVPGLVVRTSLVDRLLASKAPIVAVAAPAGYGKTTLIAQWVARSSMRSAWLTLDDRDDDPAVLVGYIAAVLDCIEPIDADVVRRVLSPGRSDLAALLRGLAALVTSVHEPFTLVLDDLEVLASQSSHDAIAELVANLPAGSRLALASRTKPPVPMARLRGQGLVFDVGIDDLAMDSAEALDLFAAEDLELSDADLVELMRRTEGWPVGIYLATLAIKAGGPLRQAGLAFQGDDRIMADYLRSEVLDRLSPATATFLVRTSVLDRLSGPVCDVVMAGAGSQQLLETIAASNLLLMPLDRGGEWYRCHNLCRDLLRMELRRNEPERMPLLHDRAAAWFEANGRPDLAIDHAQEAGDPDRAARLVAAIAQPTFAAGRVDTAFRWLGWFETRGLVERYPQVAVLAALAESMRGHPNGATRWADAATAGTFEGLLPEGSTIEAWIAHMEACLCRNGVARMRADAEVASGLLGPRSPFRGPALVFEAESRLLDGEHEGVDPLLALAVEVCVRDRITPAASIALAERAVLAIERHDWNAAEPFVREAEALVADGHLDAYLTSAIVYAVAARLAAHRGDIGHATERLARASRLRPLCTAAFPISARFLLQMAHAYLEVADPAGARAVLRQVRDIVQVRPHLGVVPEHADVIDKMVDTIRFETVGASSLTAAELRLLPLLATHLTYPEIGQRLYVSRNTVKSQTASLYRKLGVSSRGDAIARAEEIGLLDP